MRIACCITKITDTHSEYVILVEFSTVKVGTRKFLTVKLHYISCLSLHNNNINNYLQFLTKINNKINPPCTAGFEEERQLQDQLHDHVRAMPYSWL
jgi:hypothetical protein